MTRRTDIDTLRGLLLVLMTLTHLPTQVSLWANQPLGFVSMAEGFLFLSAFLAARTGIGAVREKAWSRAGTLYRYHLALMLLLLTLVAAFASFTGHVGLRNFLAPYFANPLPALLGSLVLAYQPPLLDILPMYILFLVVTPAVLQEAKSRGWARPLCLSILLWLFSQLGGKVLLYGAVTAASGWPLPIESLGPFDWFAWQVLWISGLFVASHGIAIGTWLAAPRRRFALILGALLGATFFFLGRHELAHVPIDTRTWSDVLLDKWRLGALRLLNFAMMSVLVQQLLLPFFSRVRLRFLTELGQASLPVFTMHVLACVAAIALLVNPPYRPSPALEAAVVVCALASMWWVARKTTRPGSQETRSKATVDHRVPA